MPFLINGSAASLVPSDQLWINVPLGRNLLQETIYSAYKEVRLEFDSCEAVHYQQWENVVTGGSLYTLTILAPDQITYTAYSGVILDFEKRPQFKSGMATGPWSIKVRNILQS
jgi:hypothetical protein